MGVLLKLHCDTGYLASKTERARSKDRWACECFLYHRDGGWCGSTVAGRCISEAIE